MTTVAYFVTGSAMPTMSVSWKASLPSSARGTLPVMATSGTLSIMAVARPVTRLMAPGPLRGDRHAHAARGAAVAVGRMRTALLVAHQDVAQRELAQDVVDRQDRAAGVAEDRGHALADQRLAHGTRADARRDGRRRFAGRKRKGCHVSWVPLGESRTPPGSAWRGVGCLSFRLSGYSVERPPSRHPRRMTSRRMSMSTSTPKSPIPIGRTIGWAAVAPRCSDIGLHRTSGVDPGSRDLRRCDVDHVAAEGDGSPARSYRCIRRHQSTTDLPADTPAPSARRAAGSAVEIRPILQRSSQSSAGRDRSLRGR